MQGWTTVRESYSRALEQGPLSPAVSFLHVNLSVGIHAVGEYVDGAETLSI